MYQAYFDDSGKSKDPSELALGIGGCVASAEQWQHLSEEWRKTLKYFGVSVFHATDFNASRKDFKGWDRDKNRRAQFIKNLVGIVRCCITAPLGAVLPLHSYMRLPQDKRDAVIDAYYICFQKCLEIVSLQMVGLPGRPKAEVFFANTPKFIGLAEKLHSEFQNSHPLGSLIGQVNYKKTPKDSVELQAADLVAYVLTKYLKHMAIETHWALEAFLELTNMVNHDFQFLPYQVLNEGFEA